MKSSADELMDGVVDALNESECLDPKEMPVAIRIQLEDDTFAEGAVDTVRLRDGRIEVISYRREVKE